MSTSETKQDRIEILMPGRKEKFAMWIKYRGGVMVWANCDLSNCDAGDMYTPARTEAGNANDPGIPPHWRVRYQETITDLSKFKFVKELKEVKRFRVAIRVGDSGLRVKCTDASTRKIRAACDKVQAQYKVAPSYRFDYETQECVISVPIFED
jgi:hypothetical protein